MNERGKVNLIFPHQLFSKSPLLANNAECYLIEEYLFFKQYKFHKQKIAYHRATMRYYAEFLLDKGIKANYIEAQDPRSDIRELIKALAKDNIISIEYVDVTDNWLQKRITSASTESNIECMVHSSPLFINTIEENEEYFRADRKKFFQTDFYIKQRKKLGILLELGDSPVGGKWSYDADNRKKYPKGKVPPVIKHPKSNEYSREAQEYVDKNFSENYGSLDAFPLYPANHKSAKKWLKVFFKERFLEFGTYEDAIVDGEGILHHSVLTPMLNVGLLTPTEIITDSIKYAETNGIPINSLEGFVRQIIGWREFIRGVYESKGSQERTTNYWGFDRKIPASFYDGTTGIVPIDNTIKSVMKTGYCHHIKRLMVLSNFMLLCEFDPDEVYQWFMELFIDAYDWVMVPNVYGMSQFADGGLMSTKPYISGSNYLMKMSNYKKGEWQKVWDGLFWRFMHVQRDFFLKNPRLGMLVRMYDKMPEEKQNLHLENADAFLSKL